MFFEGTEKKVEIAVEPGFPSLRSFGRAKWEQVVLKSQSKILSELHNEHCDAYLLSESSLFVYDDWALMLTCGRTTLSKAVLEMFTFIPPEKVATLIYERKNEHFPHLQQSDFFTDAKEIAKKLPGRAFRFGAQDEHHINLFHSEKPFDPPPDDLTLEILMHGIDERAARIFVAGPDHTAEHIHNKTGIREIYPGFKVDDFVFQPQGYSLNAIKNHEYYTVHVTPEKTGSYVSFETNRHLSGDALNETLDRLLSIFKPQSFDLILFQYRQRPKILDILGYQPRDEVVQQLKCGYRVSFRHYFLPQEAPRKAFEFQLENS